MASLLHHSARCHIAAVIHMIMCSLWAIFLVCGIGDGFQEFIEDVRSITSDMGAESQIAKMKNCIDAFAQHFGLVVCQALLDQAFASQNVVGALDWCHLVAGIVKHALWATPS